MQPRMQIIVCALPPDASRAELPGAHRGCLAGEKPLAGCFAPAHLLPSGRAARSEPRAHRNEMPELMNVNSEAPASSASALNLNNPDEAGDGLPVDPATKRRGALLRAAASLCRVGGLFWVTVVIPTLLGALYFGVFAEDVYVSESRFVVRSPDKPQKNGIGMLLGSAGFANASEEVRAAQGFIQSRDALRSLNADEFAQTAWGNSDVSIFDRFDPLGLSGSFEDLYKFYGTKVEAVYDAETAITTLTVRAFRPKDAQAMNAHLLQRAETLVNQLNERGSGDLVSYAEREVAEAQADASKAALALATYRNRAGVIDPERQASVQLQMISKLQDELIGARLQLLQLTAAAPQNPQISLLKVRIGGLEREITNQLGQIAGNEGSLSEAAAQYQRLQLQREFADQQLSLSLAALQDARNEARRQRAYVERVAQPSLPDAALEPRRIRGILATLIIALVAWGALSMLLAGVREHQD
jgi:capsular polysaccharide transport system permease protein